MKKMAKMNFTAGFIGAIYRYILPVFLLTMISGVGLLVAQERESVKELEPLRVIEGELGRYGSRDATAALRNSVPILETPVSVQVVPKQVMEDQAAEGLEDVYRNISGVVQAGNTLNAQSEVLPFIRGFEAPVMLRNGMRATTVGAVDLLNIESVEILKGPASILFGGLEPGGVLNYTTKRPSERKGAELSLQFGSYENYRVEMDATGPLVSGESLLFRVNAAYTDSESFRNHLKLTRAAVAPSLLWRIDSDTTLNVDFSYSREEVPYDSGIPLGLDGRSLTPAGAFFGDPELKGRILEDIFTGYTLEHRINRVFTLRTQFQYHRSEPRNESIRHRGVRGEPGAERLRLRYQNEDRTDVEYQFILDMLAEFNTGGLDHSAMIGIDWTQQETDFDRFRQNLPDVDITAEPVVRFAPPEDLRRTPTFRDQTEWIAIYFQDQISLLEESRLKLLLGGRWDQVEEDDQLTGATSDSGEFTGRIGALYELNHWLSPYASATQSFLPAGPSTVDREGVPLDPERGVQYEAGLKFQFFEQRLLATIAAYRIQKKDVAIFDLPFFFETGNFAWLSGVDQRSQGVELDVSGQINERLSLIANYAYTDTVETANVTEPSRVGRRLGNVPLQSFRLWAAYNASLASPMAGFGFGGGLRHVTERQPQFDDSINLDSYTVVDVGLWQRWEIAGDRVLRMQLNINNLFDKKFIARASDRSIAHPGPPLSAKATVSISF